MSFIKFEFDLHITDFAMKQITGIDVKIDSKHYPNNYKFHTVR